MMQRSSRGTFSLPKPSQFPLSETCSASMPSVAPLHVQCEMALCHSLNCATASGGNSIVSADAAVAGFRSLMASSILAPLCSRNRYRVGVMWLGNCLCDTASASMGWSRFTTEYPSRSSSTMRAPVAGTTTSLEPRS